MRRTQAAGQLSGWFRWLVFVTATLESENFLFWVWCQQSEFHWWLPPFDFDFFLAIAIDTYNGLPYLHSSVWLGTVAVTQCCQDMNVFYSDSKTDLKLWCDMCKNSSYSRVPKTFLVDWTLQITPALQEACLRALTWLKTSIFEDIFDFW
jgi:hypothetical protein